MLVETMKISWTRLGIEDWFVDVHHFSLIQFENEPSKFSTYVSYCEGRDIIDEDVQTVARAIKVACYVSKGIEPSDAIKVAWEKYPLVEKSTLSLQ